MIIKEDFKQIFLETASLLNVKKTYEKHQNFISEIESFIFPRLANWLSFLNTNYSKKPCMYVYTTKAVLEFASASELFKTQTKHEFETSLYFFEKIYNTSCFLSIENLQTSKLLLNIALIFGKYPGMQIRSFNKALEFLISGINESSLQTFFSYLFIKYENPKIITSNLLSLSLIEVEILMHVLQGKNIKSNPNIPIPISKMESFHLINNVPKIEFKNDVIKRSIIASKLIKKSKNPNLLERFLSCNDSFENQIDIFYSDIEFWCDAYNILANINWEIIPLTLKEFLDYFQYMRYNSIKEFSLKNKNLLSLINEINNWHEDSIFLNYQHKKKLTWKGLNAKEYEILFNNEVYTFNEITNGEELYQESKKMKHCVFVYINSCIKNFCSIWSMKKKLNTTLTNHLTIEIQNNCIVQIAGKRNCLPSESDKKIIYEWAKKAKFVYMKEKFN